MAGEEVHRSSDDLTHVDQDRNTSVAQSHRRTSVAADKAKTNVNAKLANPLAGISSDELRKQGRTYALKHFLGDESDIRAFEIGACLAQDSENWQKVDGLTPEEHAVLEKEKTSRWAQPRLMYLVIVLCSTCAAVQGMGS